MMLVMDNFTPMSGFIGGALIGAAASLLVLLHGRIAGISGIFGGLFGAALLDLPWRIAFVLGIVLGPWVVVALGGASPQIQVLASVPLLIGAGSLVGFGTRLGNGCTSGHGVCGLARGSRRSIVATVVFFTVAALTVFVMRHLLSQ